jgi:5-methylcytosine-specific restriction endonuclease McrA
MPSLKPNGKRLNGKGSGWITRKRRLAIYLRDGFRCVYCTADLTQANPREVTLDHIKPRCQGGSHKARNLVTACITCNSQRQHMTVQAFLKVLWTRNVYRQRTMRRIELARTTSIKSYLPLAHDIISGNMAGRDVC